ncbi:TPA: alpha/beta fold hydrolase [Burkholderia multivorans]|uniref:alpha/beta hydrolase n=1 Tax=Burkholderia multivorans TaxID=87883 RepID=UPI001C240F8A|nr:alpha/beta fold hydrolase [Burkholderia multivorans]MBU9351198.1 alpha/beta fold hydrolase [Burkholderia multivorans]MBU9393919.1 alpha/beta fold hydrolase [Burkholderia multivorans]HDR9833665.1 alpha/beta fold hydrolase [Burkholderia multivorans]HDR9840012.1 alpha/beta fold hydrolase [Burkholderia multivorans]HDR9847923.1 alpha/beta fold hydrolase [Burkholderia multivorans]
MFDNEPATLYMDQSAWRDLQQFLPARLRLESEDQMPTEEFWEWRGNKVHLDRYLNPNAPAKIILHHGVGTNGRQLNLIVGKPMADRGWEVTAIDNLGYGMTPAPKEPHSYDDWVQLATDYIAYERTRDDRPIVLYGLSAGGMMTYDVAAHAPRGSIKGIIGMTFLDQRNEHVWRSTAHDPFTAGIASTPLRVLDNTPLEGIKLPMPMVSKMNAGCNNPDAMRVFLADRTSAGNRASIRFLDTYHRYVPDIEPADFDICPILHTQPGADRWSPAELSKPVLDPITKVSVRQVVLENAGHYPLEEPGLTQLQDAVDAFVREVTGTNP